MQQVVHARAAHEPDDGQHVRDELAQVGHGGVHQRQVPVIAGKALAAGLPRRPQPPVAYISAQPRAKCSGNAHQMDSTPTAQLRIKDE